VIEERQPQMRGGIRQPLSRDDLIAKCHANLKFAGLSSMAAEQVTTFADEIFASKRVFSAAALRQLA
jgi:hypothetical protein